MVLMFALVLAPAGYVAENGAKGDFALVRERNPAAVFVVAPEQAEKIEACGIARGMIEDFNDDLYECAGCRLPVLEADGGDGRVIRFNIEKRTLADEDCFTIEFPDARTMLVTGSTLSIRWALVHVLEEFAGARYLGRGRVYAHFPDTADLTVPMKHIAVCPSFPLRRSFGWGDAYWDGRSYYKANVHVGESLGRTAFPVRKYMETGEWPDFIFPVIQGEKHFPYKAPGFSSSYLARWQPCFSNPQTAEHAIENLTGYFDDNPGAPGVSVGIHDMGGFCECEGCTAKAGKGRNSQGYRDYSELYWAWMNRVAGAVSEEHPGKYFTALAYREVLDPPGFSLHRSIIPYLTLCPQQGYCPDRRAALLRRFQEWGRAAENVGLYAYSYDWYDYPVAYFGLQAEMMKAAHENNVRGFYMGRGPGNAAESAPKTYLYNRLCWDIDQDPLDILRDWCEAAVGKKAAGPLFEYFRLWENFWENDAVASPWFQDSKGSLYLRMGGTGYQHALRGEDLAEMRALMASAADLAGKYGDLRQEERAGLLKREFEYAEAAAISIGGDIFPAPGVPDARQAVEYLERLAEAAEYDSKRFGLYEERRNHPELGAVMRRVRGPRPSSSYLFDALARVSAAAGEPAVLDALARASARRDIPGDVRAFCGVLARAARGEPVENIMLDGTFEEGNVDGWRNARVSSEQAFKGETSLRVALSPRTVITSRTYSTISGGRPFMAENFKHRYVEPGTHYISAMVYIDTRHPDPESYVQFRATARKDDGDGVPGRIVGHYDSPRFHVTPGRWTRISVVADTKRRGESQAGNILDFDYMIFANYERGDTAYIDDIIITPLTPG